MTAYYNEIDPYAAQWLRNLIAANHIAPGDVDERSIVDVKPDDLIGYRQCHFFAGIGGWPFAARLAGFPEDRELWTGSCPCQPFSPAGKRLGFEDKRHLWPVWARLIEHRKPSAVFGEQSAKAAQWLANVRSDLETMGYAVGAMPIEAACVGAQQRRDRYWFIASFDRGRELTSAVNAKMAASQAYSRGRNENPWPYQSRVGCVAYGVSNRMAKIRALGNAIVPQVAAEVIGAYLECRP